MPHSDRLPPRNARLLELRRRLPVIRRQLWQYPDVIGVGLGYRERRGESTREACVIVHVREKQRRVSKDRRLPKRCQDVPVDVQVRGRTDFCETAVVHDGVHVRSRGRDEVGRAGFVAKNAFGRAELLTAMHILAPDAVGRSYGREDAICVEAQWRDAPYTHVGDLVEGALTPRSDIARVRLRAGVNGSLGLRGSGRIAQWPLPPDRLERGQNVYVALAGEDSDREGTFHSRDYEASFEVDTQRRAHFRGLLSFYLDARKGWSGSLVFDEKQRPIALLSFADVEGSSGLAFGWPLHDYYKSRGLRPL